MPPKKKQVVIYEPPKPKPITFKGHVYGGKTSQYIPEFIARSRMSTIPKEIMTMINNDFRYKGKKLTLSKRLIVKGNKTFKRIENVTFVITFEPAKIIFGEYYRQMAPGSCFLVGTGFNDFEVVGTNYVVMY
jgi:hypothetical protein